MVFNIDTFLTFENKTKQVHSDGKQISISSIGGVSWWKFIHNIILYVLAYGGA